MDYNEDNIHKSERLDGEPFEDYKKRQKLIKLYRKMQKKGRLIWRSKDLMFSEKGLTFEGNVKDLIRDIELNGKNVRDYDEAKIKRKEKKGSRKDKK